VFFVLSPFRGRFVYILLVCGFWEVPFLDLPLWTLWINYNISFPKLTGWILRSIQFISHSLVELVQTGWTGFVQFVSSFCWKSFCLPIHPPPLGNFHGASGLQCASPPSTSLRETEAEVAEASGNVEWVTRWGNWGFRESDHYSPVADDEVKTPKMDGCSRDPNYATVVAGHLEPREFIENAQGPYLARQLSVFQTSTLTCKFLCVCSKLRMVCSVGTKFILVWANVPTSSLRRLALPAPLLLDARSRGYKRVTRGREGRRAPKSLMRGWT
jgi:hypothetical protein